LITIILITGIFAKYFLGYNSFVEEVAELFYKMLTGKDVNFSYEVPENPEHDLNRLLP
jgi:hypothetical protein